MSTELLQYSSYQTEDFIYYQWGEVVTNDNLALKLQSTGISTKTIT
jgi:hypothetical protein